VSEAGRETRSEEGVRGGGCHCGAVRYEVEGPMRPVVFCHCRQCRSIHGHFAAYTAAPRDAVRMVESRGLAWYAASEHARRGFCRACGSSLFWEPKGEGYLAVAAGTLREPTGLGAMAHVFTADKGDYYEIDDALLRFEQSSGGRLPGVRTTGG